MKLINRNNPASPHDRRCVQIERVDPHCKREEVGVICFQVLHIPQPCESKVAIRPVNINGKVVIIGLGKTGEPFHGFTSSSFR